MQQFIGFSIGSNQYMIPILKVREIIKTPSVTTLPHLPHYAQGVTNLRGSVIPIINLKKLLNADTEESSGSTVIVITTGKVTFGIIVDGITGVVKVEEAQIEPPDSFFSSNMDCIEGVAKLEDKLIVLLDTKKLLPLDDMSLLEEAIVNVKDIVGGDSVEVIREIDTVGGKITIKELRDATEFLSDNLNDKDPRHKVFNMMLELIDAIASHDYQQVESITDSLVKETDSDLFKEVGKITRKLHDSLEDFKSSIDHGLNKLTKESVPNAVDKLQFVMTRTEDAANKTMSIVERYFDESNDLSNHLDKVSGPEESISYLKAFKDALDNDMTEIITAQQFQDITGQTIKKVISLVNNVEVELIGLITNFGMPMKVENEDKNAQASIREEETVNESNNAAEKISQSDVEALLNDFGF